MGMNWYFNRATTLAFRETAVSFGFTFIDEQIMILLYGFGLPIHHSLQMRQEQLSKNLQHTVLHSGNPAGTILNGINRNFSQF